MSAPATRPLAAASSIIAAMALIGLIDNLVVSVAGLSGLWQFHLVRALMALPVIYAVAVLSGRPLWPKNPRAVFGRSALVSISMIFYFGALAFMPVAEVAAGLFTAPIFVLFITAMVLREPVRLLNVLAACLGFAGVLMVLRPDLDSLSPVMAMPVAAGFFYALGAMATRRWCAEEGTLSLLACFFIVMAIWGTAGAGLLAVIQPDVPDGPAGFLLRGWVTPTPEFLGITAVQALGAVAGVGLIIRGYLLGEAGFVAVFEYVLLVFAAFWGFLLWGHLIDGFDALGIALIVGSGAILARAAR